MLLSMLVSFLLARVFRGKLYVLLMLMSLVLISFFSVGIPQYNSGDSHYLTGQPAIFLDNPNPLSFPLRASLVLEFGLPLTQYYQLYFFNFMFEEHFVATGYRHGLRFLNFTMFDYVLYYSFFMLVNIVGAAIGYWLSKTAFINKLLAKKKSTNTQAVM